MSTISLENLEFYAYHGCFKEERIIGTRFLVDLFLETDTTKAEKTDNIQDTVNYQEVYLLIKSEMEQPSHLLEHVARRILDSLKAHYPQVSAARVKVSKMNPPLGGKLERVSVTLEI
ncbi:MAG: dihydroneopterin aldolase [Bacteroidetes bacterium]|nr:dihydroneopterin aldolase [Bacteroidota bacterium]